MPADSEHHAGLAGPIRLLETPDCKRYAYSEGQETGRLIADQKDVATLPSTIHVRDSKLPTSPELTLSPAAWAPFVGQAGDFGPDSLPSGS